MLQRLGRLEAFGGKPIKVEWAGSIGTDCYWIAVAIGDGYVSCAAAAAVTVV